LKKNKEGGDGTKNSWIEGTKTLISFFLNLHNFTILYGLCIAPLNKYPTSAQDWINYSKSISIKVADCFFTPYEIQHLLLRASMAPPDDPYFAKEYPSNALGKSKARFKCSKAESLINFGFYYPYKSSPSLKIFGNVNLIRELAEVAKAGLDSCSLDVSTNQITFPPIIAFYKKDFLSGKYNKNFMVVLKTKLFGNATTKDDKKIAKWYLYSITNSLKKPIIYENTCYDFDFSTL